MKTYTINQLENIVKNANISYDHHCDDSTDCVYLGHDDNGLDMYGQLIGGAAWSCIEIDGTMFEFTQSWKITEDEDEITYYEHEHDGSALVNNNYTRDLTFAVIDEDGDAIDYFDIIQIIRDTRDDLYDFDLDYNFDEINE